MRDYERSWLLRSAVERGVRRKRKHPGISDLATRKHEEEPSHREEARHSGWSEGPDSDVQLHIGESRDSGFALRAPRNDVPVFAA